MLVLGIESSCDETCAAVLEMPRRRILSNIVASQVGIHAKFGGVVPEIASRAHTEAISGITYKALEDANVTLADIGAVAVTSEPGLIGALLVGVNFAKSLAYANGIPLVAVNHIYAHAAAAYPVFPELKPSFLAYIVSGGHTTLFEVRSETDFKAIGRSRDDAAGEAFDKVGRVMGLNYPCGADMDKLASEGFESGCELPRFPSPAIADDSLDLSFSGMKTAVINYLNTKKQKGEEIDRAAVAAGFTSALTAGMCKKLAQALERSPSTVLLCGGVAANSHLRAAVAKTCSHYAVKCLAVPPYLCGDNAVMVASQGYFEFMSGRRAELSLNGRAW